MHSLRLHPVALALLVAGCPAESPPPDGGTPSLCPALTGAGVVHDTNLATAQTWSAADSPHVIKYDTTVSAAITLEACAVVRIAAGRTVTIASGGALVAAGAVGQPVTIERLDASAAWASIRAMGGDLSLTHAIVRGGGDPMGNPTLGTMVLMQRNVGGLSGSLHVDDVEVADSASQGISLPSVAGFDSSSQNLRIHGAAGYPIFTWARVVGSIPSGDYTGNGVDEVLVSSEAPVVDDQTMHLRGVPYRVGINAESGVLDVASQTGGLATLTIEPGVTVKFKASGQLRIEPSSSPSAAKGALIAVGTAAAPIVFTSAEAAPAAGDWFGLWFGGLVSPTTVLQHTRVEYAGKLSTTGSNSCPYPGRTGQNDAAIRVVGPPPGAFVTDSEILASARDGIDRGWRADLQPDFLPTNTFTQVAGCQQSTPRTNAGVCPPTPACP